MDYKQLQKQKNYRSRYKVFQRLVEKISPYFWAKVSENHDLFQLQKQVHVICEENGFSLETRPYHPHITVARKWIGEEKFHLESIKEVPEISFQADTITLYESHVKENPEV